MPQTKNPEQPRTLMVDLNDVHLELNSLGWRRMHETEQRSQVLIATTADNQLLYDAEWRPTTDVMLHHAQHTSSATTLTKHTYATHAHNITTIHHLLPQLMSASKVHWHSKNRQTPLTLLYKTVELLIGQKQTSLYTVSKTDLNLSGT